MRRIVTFVATFVLIVGAGLLTLTTSASAVPEKPIPTGDANVMRASCYVYGTDVDTSAWRATGNGANMRVGASTACPVSGVARSGDRLDYHCYEWIESTGLTWTYLRNDTTGRVGWVRDSLLSDNGSAVPCVEIGG